MVKSAATATSSAAVDFHVAQKEPFHILSLFGGGAAAGHGRATAGRLQGFAGLFGVAAGLDHSEPSCHLEYARLSPAFAWPLPSSSLAKPSWENFATLALV